MAPTNTNPVSQLFISYLEKRDLPVKSFFQLLTALGPGAGNERDNGNDVSLAKLQP